MPISLDKLKSDGLYQVEYSGNEKIITTKNNINDVLSAFSEILDSTGQYKDFKNTDDRFFTLYDFEDVWLINWETKAKDILEVEDCYAINKNTGEVQHYYGNGDLKRYVHYLCYLSQ